MKLTSTLLVLFALCLARPIVSQAQNANVSDSTVLVDFYNSTGGATWKFNTGWLKGPVKNWYGVVLDANGRVDTINILVNNLTGILPESLSLLQGLKYLGLSYNNIGGTLPTSLGDLSQLENLYLGHNQISGIIPASYGNLGNLVNLSFSGNILYGGIPSSLGSLGKLQSLFLDNNLFSGSIPTEFGNLASLQVLALNFNSLSGSIPSSLGNLSNLTALGLIGNQLTGSIPSTLGQLTNLTTLALNVNSLSGTVPASLTNLKNLQAFYLNSNNFTFDGMESIATNFPQAVYAPQDTILPLQLNNKILSVTAGGTLANNTYTWYNGATKVAQIKGNALFAPNVAGRYSVTVTNSVVTQVKSSTDLTRDLIFNSDTVTITDAELPVTMLNFSGQLSHGAAILSWQTATEVNTAYFNIQRSQDGAQFNTVGKTAAAGNSSVTRDYQFTDAFVGLATPPPVSYYRLQEADKNGALSYSKIIKLVSTGAVPSLTVMYPNPVRNTLNIQVNGIVGQAVVAITNADGKRMLAQQVNVNGSIIPINTSTLAAGVYILQVEQNGQNITEKFVKQ